MEDLLIKSTYFPDENLPFNTWMIHLQNLIRTHEHRTHSLHTDSISMDDRTGNDSNNKNRVYKQGTKKYY